MSFPIQLTKKFSSNSAFFGSVSSFFSVFWNCMIMQMGSVSLSNRVVENNNTHLHEIKCISQMQKIFAFKPAIVQKQGYPEYNSFRLAAFKRSKYIRALPPLLVPKIKMNDIKCHWWVYQSILTSYKKKKSQKCHGEVFSSYSVLIKFPSYVQVSNEGSASVCEPVNVVRGPELHWIID